MESSNKKKTYEKPSVRDATPEEIEAVNAKINSAKILAVEPKYPLLAAIHNACEKLGV